MPKPTPRAQVIERLAKALYCTQGYVRPWRQELPEIRHEFRSDADHLLACAAKSGLRITLAPTAKKKAKRR